MANTLKHKFTSPKADVGDASLVRASNWNDEHVFAGAGADDDVLVSAAAQTDKVTWKSIASLLTKILTTKGDIIGRDASTAVRVPVGADDSVLTAKASEAAGVKWQPLSALLGSVPAGAGMEWYTDTPPSGWLMQDGSEVSRVTYAALFAVIGTTFGSGDGTNTFNLPLRKSRFPIGKDTGDPDYDAIGKTGGEKTHVLTQAEMPAHVHNVQHVHTITVGTNDGSGTAAVQAVTTNNPSTQNTGTSPTNSGSTGSGAAHNNVPPFIVVNWIIKT